MYKFLHTHPTFWAGIFLSFFAFQAQAADFYWKGGSGNYNDPNMWWIGSFASGNTASQSPISGDNVFFTTAAFSSPGNVVTLDVSSNCANMTWDLTGLPAANKPTFAGAAGIRLDIFGNLRLDAQMNFNVSGLIYFSSVQSAGTVHTITSNGQRFLCTKFVINCNPGVEYRLADDLWVDDPSQSFTSLTGGTLWLEQGHFNTNAKRLTLGGFISNNNNPNRRLTIDNSNIRVENYHTQEYAWDLDFNKNTANYTGFSATGSHIRNVGWGYTWLTFGTGLKYDTISMEANRLAPNGSGEGYNYTYWHKSSTDTVNHLFVNRHLCFNFTSANELVANNIYVYKGATISANNSTPTIVTDNIQVLGAGCQAYAKIGDWGGNIAHGRINFRKATPGNLNFDRFLMVRTTGITTGGRTYTATNSVNQWDNIDITFAAASASRDFYFRDGGNQDWHTVANWQTFNGSVFSAATCLPDVMDNVFFDNLSFPNANKRVKVDSFSGAVCNNMTWLPSVAVGSFLDMGGILTVFGTLRLHANMGTTTHNPGYQEPYLLLAGNTADSLICNTVPINIYTRLIFNADYLFFDDVVFNTAITARLYTKITAKNINITTRNIFYHHRLDFDNVQLYSTNNAWWAIYMDDWSNFSLRDYKGNTTYHFQATNGMSRLAHGDYPNVVVYPDVQLAFYYYIRVEGDLTLQTGSLANFGYNSPFQTQCELHIVGDMAAYNGNLNMDAGAQLIFPSQTASNKIVVSGDINVNGNCAQLATIKTVDGNSLLGGINVLGSQNINFGYIQGMKNVSLAPNTTLNASNSVDGGNNPGWNFGATAPSQTFYWRARNGTTNNFVGNWSDPRYWTTTQAKVDGDNACIPGINDDVVFDNMSFIAGSNDCRLGTGQQGYCRNITFLADAKLSAGQGDINGTRGNLDIKGSLTLFTNATNFLYYGDINFVGAGDIRSNGTPIVARQVNFRNPAGVWNMRDAMHLDNSSIPASSYDRRWTGYFNHESGTFNTNDFPLTISSYFQSTGTQTRTLNFGNSIIRHKCDAWYYYYWRSAVWEVNNTGLTMNFGANARLIFEESNTYTFSDTRPEFYMANFNYPNVSFTDVDHEYRIFGNANYRYLEMQTTSYFDGNNSMDSLRLEGGYFYRFKGASVQTLNAPHGKIISNGTGSAFVNIESSNATSFTLRKLYGAAFCVDFVKVKNSIGLREPILANVPAAYQVMHPFLEFQTGINSDNIGGTATGIWAFSLPPLVSPQYTGSPLANLCRIGTINYIPITLTGTSPYRLDYTWVDNASGSGGNGFTVVDDDNNPSTPFVYSLSVSSSASLITYTLNSRTSRCGEFTPNNYDNITVSVPAPNVLVSVNRSGACTFNNEVEWLTLIDNVQRKPIVSLQDMVNVADVSALGNVSTDVYFDATVQTYNHLGINYPYLQRRWTISPTNNGQANVRLYFTQAELNALAAANTYVGSYTGTLNPATDLQVFKFSGNAVGVGALTIISPTLVPITGAVATPFSSSTNIYCLEFPVSSFSHFIIVPTTTALLPLDLLSFDVKSQDQKTVDVSWSVNADNQVLSYEVQRSANAVEAQTVGTVTATSSQNYSLNDAQPLSGVSYYRIKELKRDGTFAFSDWKSVEIRRVQIMEVFPVPAKDQLNIRVRTYNSNRVYTKIYDNFGRMVVQQSHTVQPETMELLNLNTDRLANGIYTLQCVDAQGAVSSQVFEISR
jgi:Secretion system C-terminal sorting domain